MSPVSTTRDDTEHEAQSPVEPSRACRQDHEGCDLNSVNETEITPHEAEFRGEGNRLLPSAGRGEGVRPHDPARGKGLNQFSAGNQRYATTSEPRSGPVAGSGRVKPPVPCNTFVTFEVCYS